MDERVTIVLIEALARIWTAIRENHPDVPGVVLLPAPNPHRQTSVLGHFAPLRWTPQEKEGRFWHEVVVVAEHLNRPAQEVLGTLLHEAVHALNFARGIKDCSANQYHNRKFRAVAEELGLAVQQVRHYGYAHTVVPPETADLYLAQTQILESVLIHRRSLASPHSPPGKGPIGPSSPTGKGNGRSRSLKAVCACPFIIRVARKTLQDTTIRCDTCHTSFQLSP